MSCEVKCLTTNNESNMEKVGWCACLGDSEGQGTDHVKAKSWLWVQPDDFSIQSFLWLGTSTCLMTAKCPKHILKWKSKKTFWKTFQIAWQVAEEKWLKEPLCLLVRKTGVCQWTTLTNWKKKNQQAAKLVPNWCGEERKNKWFKECK